jgi:intein-encoded DNA endonuclease-like protein
MPVTRKDLDEMYNSQRMTLREIAQHLGVSVGVVCRQMDALDLPRRSISDARRIPLDEAEIVRLYEERHSLDEIAQRFNVCANTILDRLKAYNIDRRGLSEAHITYPRRDFDGNPLTKAYLQGFCHGDMSVSMATDGMRCATIEVSSSTTKEAQLNLYNDLFGPYGHATVYTGTNNSYGFKCRLNMSFAFLLEKEDRVPEWILPDFSETSRLLKNSNFAQPFLAFLAGYIDAEGCFHVSNDGKNARFSLSSYDIGLLRQIYNVLNALDVLCPPVRLHIPKGTPFLDRKTRKWYFTKGDSWNLAVNRKTSLYRLCELLEPYLRHANRRTDMYAVWANVTARGV